MHYYNSHTCHVFVHPTFCLFFKIQHSFKIEGYVTGLLLNYKKKKNTLLGRSMWISGFKESEKTDARQVKSLN